MDIRPYHPPCPTVLKLGLELEGRRCRRPDHRSIVMIRIQPSGQWELAAYARTPEPAFLVWKAGDWLDIGTEGVDAWTQRPPRPRQGETEEQLYGPGRRRLPWWLREGPGKRSARHRCPVCMRRSGWFSDGPPWPDGIGIDPNRPEQPCKKCR